MSDDSEQLWLSWRAQARSQSSRHPAFTVAVEVFETDLQLQLIRAGIGVGIILRRALPPRLQGTGLQTFTVSDLSLMLVAWLWHRCTGPVIAVTMPLPAQFEWGYASDQNSPFGNRLR